MALDRSVLVPRPEHGTVLKTVSGKTYVYYATAVYRNEKGQPTCDRTSIGRLDEESGMLIPNRNYYEVYLKQSQPMQGSVMDYGVFYVFMAIAEKLGLTAILKKYFPDSYKEILTAAHYMLSEGNVKKSCRRSTWGCITAKKADCRCITESIRGAFRIKRICNTWLQTMT